VHHAQRATQVREPVQLLPPRVAQPPHHRVEPRRLRLVHRLRPVHHQHELVREPVRDDVHDRGEHERDDHALLAGDRLTRQQEDRRQDAEQETGLQDVGHAQKVANPPGVVKLASNALTGADPADILGRFTRKILQ